MILHHWCKYKKRPYILPLQCLKNWFKKFWKFATFSGPGVRVTKNRVFASKLSYIIDNPKNCKRKKKRIFESYPKMYNTWGLSSKEKKLGEKIWNFQKNQRGYPMIFFQKNFLFQNPSYYTFLKSSWIEYNFCQKALWSLINKKKSFSYGNRKIQRFSMFFYF